MQNTFTIKVAVLFLLVLTTATISTNAQQTKTVALKNYNQISVSSGIDLYLSQGNTESIKIVSGAELLKNVIIAQKGTHLSIRYKENISWERIFKGQAIKVYVSLKNLTQLSASGGSDVYSQNTLKAEKLALHASGGADVKLSLIAQNVEIHASGGADVDLKGKATNMNINSSGGSDINAYDFIVENARVHSSGGADVNIHVTNALDAHASGGSDINFKGNASLKKNASKSGDVNRIR
jgi:hypothetical protein